MAGSGDFSEVPPRSLDAALAYVKGGGKLIIPTYTQCTIIDGRCLARWEKAGQWLLREDGNGYRIHRGRHSDYLFPGQLRYA